VSRKVELAALLAVDLLAFWLAYTVHYQARFEWVWFEPPSSLLPRDFLVPGLVLTAFWLLVFFFFGMYREKFASSRFDELTSIVKVVTVGVLILVFAIFIESIQPGAGRTVIGFYWLVHLLMVAAGRLLVRSFQKALILRGHGVHKALIVGWSDLMDQLHEELARYPEAGLRIVGAIRLQRPGESGEALPPFTPGDGGAAVLTAPRTDFSPMETLPQLIDELEVQDVLIALGSEDHGALWEVLRLCDGKAVTLKLVPDFYSVIGGMARTEHIYGLPLIEVLPEPMPVWEQSTKRLLDLLISLLVLLLGLPLWLTLAALVRLTSSGPAIYRQTRVGQHGKPFTMYKFRTMHQHAEARTGPVFAQENDPRYTPLGRWLRRTRLDEIPQFWNVLVGQMSLVGPRPERPFFVEQLARDIPLYNRRHRIKPGITGWAQVKWKYTASLEEVRQKVKYDLFYIENMSLLMDLKILFRTLRTALLARGR
jgi:exopolysaccharide biosynthesis polyprenyl glycosylphosphotransferase